MKHFLPLVLFFTCLTSCTKPGEMQAPPAPSNPMVGSWRLVQGTIIMNNDTTITDYTKDTSMIKIINDTHFAFLLHDKNKGKDSTTAFFVAGGGPYTYKDSTYTEHLEYCNAREWEGHDFSFRIEMRNDTLIQHGREKVDSAGIDRIIVERYVKVQ